MVVITIYSTRRNSKNTLEDGETEIKQKTTIQADLKVDVIVESIEISL